MRTNSEQDFKRLQYVDELSSIGGSSDLEKVKKKSKDIAEKINKAAISISVNEGKLLSFFVRIFNCKKFVEIGTLTGYSAICILEGMPMGELWTLESNPAHAEISREILGEACGILSKTKKVSFNLILGDARESLVQLCKGTNKPEYFDGIFIDGNKAAYIDYLNWVEENISPGGIIVADNVFLSGSVYGEEAPRFSKKQIEVMQKFNKRLADPKKYESIFIPTSEGMVVAIKK